MKRPFIGFVAALLIAAMAEPCFACSCVPMEPQQRVGRAAAVFTGTVIDAKPESFLRLSEEKAHNLLHRNGRRPSYGDAVFDVSRVYKGDVHQTQWVSGHGDSSSCGFTFEPGKTYTVFAYMNDGGYLETGICNGVFSDDFVPQDYDLDGFVSPIVGVGTNSPQSYAVWLFVLAAAGALTAAVFIVRAGVRFARRFGSKADPSP